MLLAGEVLYPNTWYAPFYSLAVTQVLLLCSHLSLLDSTRRGTIIRLLLFVPTSWFIIDFSINPKYSFGTNMRDLALGVIGWYMFAKALDVGIVHGLEGKEPPRWCVPDWTLEAKKEDDVQVEIPSQDSSGKQLPFWKRTPIPDRPKWAIESNYLPTNWRLLPLPTRLIDQLLWTIDVITLRRPGTSLLLPNEMRALDWSQKRLEKAAKCRREKGDWKAKCRLDPTVTPFGYSETSFSDAIIEWVVLACCVYYLSGLDLPASSPGGFYAVPMYQQLAIATSMGVLITCAGDLPELLAFPILQKWPFNYPCTAITPHFRNVVRSNNLSDMWGFQWHGFIKRDIMRLALLIPFARKSRIFILLKSFFWSAVFHSFFFVRVRPDISLSSPLTLFRSLYFPGAFSLFMGQGLLVILENIFISLASKAKLYRRIKSNPLISTIIPYFQVFYVYGSLIWMARWLIADLVPLNLLSHKEISGMSLSNQWNDYSKFWSERWNDLFT